jgi:hypothetical protein
MAYYLLNIYLIPYIANSGVSMATGKQRMVTGLINFTALMKRPAGATIAFCLLLAMQPAQAGLIFDDSLLGQEILGGSFFVAEEGDVTATFLGSDAGYFNELYLFSPDSPWDTSEMIFDKDSPVDGSMKALGSYAAGTELVFRLYVQNTALSYFTGDGSNNPDNLAHARAVTRLVDGVYVTEVGFEDLLGGGDLDYNDFMFGLNNVVDPDDDPRAVPEPSILLLLSGVLFSMIMFLRLGRGRTH